MLSSGSGSRYKFGFGSYYRQTRIQIPFLSPRYDLIPIPIENLFLWISFFFTFFKCGPLTWSRTISNMNSNWVLIREKDCCYLWFWSTSLSTSEIAFLIKQRRLWTYSFLCEMLFLSSPIFVQIIADFSRSRITVIIIFRQNFYFSLFIKRSW